MNLKHALCQWFAKVLAFTMIFQGLPLDQLSRTYQWSIDPDIMDAIVRILPTESSATAAESNQPPDCSGAYPSNDSLWPVNHKMNDITIQGVTDPDGDPVEITIQCIYQDEPLDDTGDGSTDYDADGIGTSVAQIRAERSGNGNGRVYHITYSASDSFGNTCSGEVTVEVKHSKSDDAAVDDGLLYESVPSQYPCSQNTDNNPPVITSRPVYDVREGEPYTYDVEAEDPDMDVLSYSLKSAPSGMEIDSVSGLITWDLPENGDYQVEVLVSDGMGGSDSQSWTLSVQGNRPPVFTSQPQIEVQAGTDYFYLIEADDPDDDVVTFRIIQAPDGMIYDPNASTDSSTQVSLLGWPTTEADIGDHEVILEADDGNGGTATQTWVISVVPVNNPPEILNSPPETAGIGETFTHTVEAVDPDEDTLTYALFNPPSGMTIDSQSGVITWTPTEDQLGPHNFSILVYDPQDMSDTQPCIIDVLSSNQAPRITSDPVTQWTSNDPYRYQVIAEDPDQDIPLTFSLVSSPEGMTIDLETGEILWIVPESFVQGQTDPDPYCAAVETDENNSIAPAADIIFVIDESGSMPGEQAWTKEIVPDLELSLLAMGVGGSKSNLYGLIGFTQRPREIEVDGACLGSASGYLTAADELSTSYPGWEDGWRALNYAIEEYPHRYDTAKNLILVTDEDRDNLDSRITYESILNDLIEGKFILNAVVDCKFQCQDGREALGIDAKRNGYVADGFGGCETCENAIAIGPEYIDGWDEEYVIEHYVNLALETGGAAWNLNYLRSGGNYTKSFTSTFIDLKVKEISEQFPSEDQADLTLSNISLISNSNCVVLSATAVNRGLADASGPLTVKYYKGTTQTPEALFGEIPLPEGLSAGESQLVSISLDALPDNTTEILAVIESQEVLDECHSGNNQILGAVVGIKVSDPDSFYDEQFFIVNAVASNQDPVITSEPSTTGYTTQEYLYTVEAYDPDKEDSCGYSLLTAPYGMTIDTLSGSIRWTPSEEQVGDFTIEVLVDDGHGGSSLQSWLVVISEASNAPAILNTPPSTAMVDVRYEHTIEATDPDGDTLIYSLSESPDGMTINASTGSIQWMPTADQVGYQTLSIKVEDGLGGSATQKILITVLPYEDNEAPVAAFTIQYESWRSLEFDGSQSSDPEGRALISWKWSFGDGSTGFGETVNHSYTSPGDYTITLTVFDDKGASHTVEQTVTLTHPEPNTNPEVTAIGPYMTFAGSGITVSAEGSDPDDDILTYSWNDGTQDISGQTVTLSFETPGLYDITVTCEDGYGGSDQDATYVVVYDPDGSENPVAPEVTLTSPQSGDIIRGLVDIQGEIKDDNLLYWTLDYTEENTSDWKRIAKGTGTLSGELAAFDTSPLENGNYYLMLSAYDNDGLSSYTSVLCLVDNKLNLGAFSLEYTDLEMPLAGLPIKILRRYTTLDADDMGDFGYGWKLGYADPEIRETVPWDPDSPLAGVLETPYKVGTRLYLTDPEGRRIGFTFDPEPVYSLIGTFYTCRFTPDPGVNYELEVDGGVTLRSDGTYWVFFALPYNPSDFRLVSRDGTKYYYNQFEGLQKVVDANGNELTFTDNGIFHSGGQSIQLVRDSQNRIQQIIDPQGHSIVYEYDGNGDLVSVTDQENLKSTYGYYTTPAHYICDIDDAAHPATRYEYDENGRIAKIIDALGNEIQQAWDPENLYGTYTDAKGNVTEYTYDIQGNLIKEKDPLGGITTYTYDEDNNKASVTDERGNTTSFTYDENANMLSKTEPIVGTTSYTYNDLGKKTSETDPLGRTRTWEYDTSGNMISYTTAVEPGQTGNTLSIAYDSSGRILRFYDFKGNEYRLDYNAGTSGPSKVIFPDGAERSYAYHWTGQISEITEESGVQKTVYDNIGRKIMDQDKLGNQTTYTYDGYQLESKTVPLNGPTWYDYNEAAQLTQSIDPLNGTAHYAYDVNGNLESVIDPVGNETRFVYDDLNRLIQTIDPLGNETLMEYDAADNQTRIIDRNGQVRKFDYDALNRLYKETWYDGSDAVNEINYTYNHVDKLTAITDMFSTLSYTYNALNQITSADNSGTAFVPEIKLTYQYDANGNIISTTDSQGIQRAAGYDERNRLKSLAWAPLDTDPVEVAFEYGSCCGLMGISRYVNNGVLQPVTTSTFTRDALSRVATLTHTIQTLNSSTDAVAAEYNYLYDAVGRLEQETHHGSTFNYAYDLTDQLTGSERDVFGPESFSYDANGNRNSSGYTVGIGNQILSDPEFDYKYDNEGNLILKTSRATGNFTAYEFDHRNRLVKVEERTSDDTLVNEAYYLYDAKDRRISTAVNGTVTYHVYDNENVWADFDGYANLETSYLFGKEIDSIFARSRPGQETIWYLKDRLGTVRDLADSSGNVINHIDYDSFGSVIAQTSPDQGDRFMFTGREYEPVFNMYYYRARYYSPDLGRFMSQDPLEFDAGDLNLYRYIGNGPLNGTDPDGENSIIEYVILNSLLINCGYNLGNFMYAIHECYFSESNPSNLMDCLAQLILNLNNIIWMALSCGTAMKGGGKL